MDDVGFAGRRRLRSDGRRQKAQRDDKSDDRIRSAKKR
jgi:hypothetical protein